MVYKKMEKGDFNQLKFPFLSMRRNHAEEIAKPHSGSDLCDRARWMHE